MPLEIQDLLENEYVDNCKQMQKLSEINYIILRKLAKIFHKVEVGTIVVYKGTKYKVQRVDIKSWSVYERTHKPWVDAIGLKKDGTWGSRARCIYGEWELP